MNLLLSLRSPLFACTLSVAGFFASHPALAESSAPVPRLASLLIDDVVKNVRTHLATRPGEDAAREIIGVQFIPPHGRAGPGFWLVDLAPYPSDRPTPARAFTSLLIGMDGKIEERGGRRPLDAQETLDRDRRPSTLQERMQAATAAGAPAAASSSSSTRSSP